MSDRDTLNEHTRCAAVARPSCRTSIPTLRNLQVSARARVYLPSLFMEAPGGCAGSELQQDSRKAVFQQGLKAVPALSVAGSVSGIRILLCSPHLALLQGAYFYPCSVFLLPSQEREPDVRQRGTAFIRIRTRMQVFQPYRCGITGHFMLN